MINAEIDGSKEIASRGSRGERIERREAGAKSQRCKVAGYMADNGTSLKHDHLRSITPSLPPPPSRSSIFRPVARAAINLRYLRRKKDRQQRRRQRIDRIVEGYACDRCLPRKMRKMCSKGATSVRHPRPLRRASPSRGRSSTIHAFGIPDADSSGGFAPSFPIAALRPSIPSPPPPVEADRKPATRLQTRLGPTYIIRFILSTRRAAVTLAKFAGSKLLSG